MITANDLIGKFQQALTDKWGYIWGTSGEKWTALKQENLEKTTDSDRALSRQYGKKWIGHMVADCSGLFTWAFKQLGGTMYHGSNTMYLKWCAQKGKLNAGKREDFATLKPGTAVFVWNGKSYSHVGLFVGGETVIEAQGTKAGVTTSKVSATKWTHWGELVGVDYDGTQPAPVNPQEPAEDRPTLRRGSKGDWVKLLQQELIRAGYDCGSYGADGDFGKATLAAVQKFQKEHGLIVDGVVGPKTWEKLLAADAKPEKKYTATISGLTSAEAEKIRQEYPAAKIAEEG